MDRRAFLKNGLVATAAFTSLGASVWRRALANHPAPVLGPGPYGALGAPDANNIRLPAGFTSKRIATSGELVPGTLYPWHHVPDGAATFATGDGGWIYVCNSEAPSALGGGASAIRFGADGEIESAYRVLAGSNLNCAGGPTPWGTWLSCEEHPNGYVWECDPTGILPGIPRPALGAYAHEAAAVDPVLGHVYLTEDEDDGCFYRFTPDTKEDLTFGVLEVARWDTATGAVTWHEVPEPTSGLRPARNQDHGGTRFDGGEGAWFDAVERTVYFTTKGDDRLWAYHVDAMLLEIFFNSRATPGSPLNGVDNVTVSPGREIFVCEDHSSDPHQLVMLAPGEPTVVSPFLELVGHTGSELTGVCFNPAGDRMYVGSQRGTFNMPPVGIGMTYEITGPFNR